MVQSPGEFHMQILQLSFSRGIMDSSNFSQKMMCDNIHNVLPTKDTYLKFGKQKSTHNRACALPIPVTRTIADK